MIGLFFGDTDFPKLILEKLNGINPKTICVEASEEKMIKQMEGFGMEVIPVPFRDAYAFGGSLHCATTDVYREGECEDYFPNQ